MSVVSDTMTPALTHHSPARVVGLLSPCRAGEYPVGS